MKNALIIIFALFYIKSNAQLTLEHTYYKNYGVSVINLEGIGQKLLLIDTGSKDVILYNTDYSHWKTIKLDIPVGCTFSSVHWLATKLLDTDLDIELSYSYYYKASSVITYNTHIGNEDGSLVKILYDITSTFPVNVAGNWKLFARDYDSYLTDIYGVPGTYLGIVTKPEIELETETKSLLYPNPMEFASAIKYNLPSGCTSAELSVYDMNGKELRSYKIDGRLPELLIRKDELPSGIYFYRIYDGLKEIHYEKFVIK